MDSGTKANHRRSRFCWAVLVFLLVFVLTGCLPHGAPADLVIINGQEPETLDPAIATGLEDLRAIMALFEGLTRYDPKTARPRPGLAERWEISTDGRGYTFHLRTNAIWSTGEPITAEDVVYSWVRVLKPETAAQYASQLFYIKNAEAFNAGRLTDASQLGFRALDPATLAVELNHPTWFFLDLCAFQTLAVVPRGAIEAHGDRWLRMKSLPVSGPFELVEWSLNDRIRLRKNRLYWDAAQTGLERVDLLPIGNPNTAINLYESGKADIIWDKEIVPAELLEELKRRPDYHSFDYLGTYFIRFNVTRRPFSDARVRRALALAVDKKRLVEKITRGGERVAHSFVPPGTAHHRAPAAALAYDPQAARALLAEAGFPKGQGFPTFQYLFDSAAGAGGKTHAKIAVELQEMWEQELGIDMELRQMEKKAYLPAQKNLDYDVSRSSWIGDYNDPNTFLDLFLSNNGNNRTGWKNGRYDALMAQANQEIDLEKRALLLQEAETILVREEAPVLPLFFYAGFNYYNPSRIRGVYSNLLDLHPINAMRVQTHGFSHAE